MLISLKNEHKEHLNLLIGQSPHVLTDFLSLAVDFLQNGPNFKLYNIAATKMKVDVDRVLNCVYGLLNLLFISCKNQLSDNDFRDSILTIGFSNDQQTLLSRFYSTKKSEITEILKKLSVQEPHFEDLEWRFEVQVASRSLLHHVEPMIAMNLHLRNDGPDGCKISDNILQTDITTLMKITSELERAQLESRSRHSRKIQQAVEGINKM